MTAAMVTDHRNRRARPGSEFTLSDHDRLRTELTRHRHCAPRLRSFAGHLGATGVLLSGLGRDRGAGGTDGDLDVERVLRSRVDAVFVDREVVGFAGVVEVGDAIPVWRNGER